MYESARDRKGEGVGGGAGGRGKPVFVFGPLAKCKGETLTSTIGLLKFDSSNNVL